MRPIDADDLDILGYMEEFPTGESDETWNAAVSQIAEYVNFSPTLDVVPVVRCRDCEYYRESALLAPNMFCFRLKHPTEDRPIGYNFAPDDFCSHGKLKEPR